MIQQQNAYAASVWKRVRLKLEGRDPDPARKHSNQEQVSTNILLLLLELCTQSLEVNFALSLPLKNSLFGLSMPLNAVIDFFLLPTSEVSGCGV